MVNVVVCIILLLYMNIILYLIYNNYFCFSLAGQRLETCATGNGTISAWRWHQQVSIHSLYFGAQMNE